MYRNLLPGLQEHSGEVEHTAHLFVKFVSHFYTVATCSGYYMLVNCLLLYRFVIQIDTYRQLI